MKRRLQHAMAAVVSVAIVVFVTFDRRDPVSFISGQIIPNPARHGDSITVRLKSMWHRACEAEVSREIVGSDLIVRHYLKFLSRIPVELGEQTSDNSFELSPALPPGLTAYRALLRFEECGLTSRLWPLSVYVPALFFEVK